VGYAWPPDKLTSSLQCHKLLWWQIHEPDAPDLAVQAHVLRDAGLTIRRTELMQLNRDCRYPDLSNLFVREDLTPEIEELLADIPRDIRAQQRMLRGPLPDVPVRLPLPRALPAQAGRLRKREQRLIFEIPGNPGALAPSHSPGKRA
jgi:hypothetical protein